MPRVLPRLLVVLLSPLVNCTATAQDPPQPSAERISFAQLADHEVAKRLELTDEQRARVAAILADLADALEGATDERRAALSVESERQLEAVLSPEQRGVWNMLWQPPPQDAREAKHEPRLRFNFRFQPWVDVLTWLAESADLSLVLDAPPPGTFNYTDSRTYSASDAIDLLNGVLATKGYTIIRRERMLLLVNLADGIPQDLIPEITVDELERRGRFELASVVFPLGQLDAAEVAAEIAPLLGPHGKSTALAKTRQLIVTETASKLRAIRSVIEAMPQPKTPPPAAPPGTPEQPVLATHLLGSVNAKAAMEILDAVLHDTPVAHDVKSGQLVVFAAPSKQEAVKATLAAMRATQPDGAARRLVVYTVGRGDPATIISGLQPSLEGAHLVPDSRAGSVIAWATDADHEKLRAAVEALEQQPGGEKPAARVYHIDGLDTSSVLTTLRALLPAAQYTFDAQTGALVATARPGDQETITSTLDALKSHAGAQRKLVVYPVRSADVTAVMGLLKSLVPSVQVVSDAKSASLLAWAQDMEHEKIRATVEQLDRAAGAERPTAKTYRLDGLDSTSVLTTLRTLVPAAQMVVDPKTGNLTAAARAADQELIAATLETMRAEDSTTSERRVVSYALSRADVSSIFSVLQPLVPEARLVPEPRSGAIVAWATEKDHRTIQATLEQLELQATARPGAQFRAYELESLDGASLLTTLQTLFAARPEVRLSIDQKNRKLVAWAPTVVHQDIQAAMDEIRGQPTAEDTPQLEVHDLAGADPATATRMISAMVATMHDAQVFSDAKSGQVAVLARLRDQAAIRATIEQLRSAAPEVDVLPLRVVDPMVAESAIEQLFSGGHGGDDPAAPRVDTDLDSGQLFVRGSRQQLAQIRALLEKMGESGLATAASGSGRTVRVIPLSGRMSEAVLAEIQRIWPTLRSNPIRVVTPSALVPAARGNGDEPAVHAAPAERKAAAPRLAEPPVTAVPEGNGGPGEPPAEPSPASAEPAGDKERGARAPIVVTRGPNEITILSDDIEALDQFEALVRSMSGRMAGAGRDFTVFNLRSANAATVAETLTELFRGGLFSSSSSSLASLRIVADRRLNAIIVHAPTSELAMIESLLEVLDSPNVPETLLANKPKLIPVVNGEAHDIAEVIRDVYRTQLTSGANRPPLPVPTGVSREVALVLQQIQAASTGPEMTLGVDEATNSIVLLAAPPLFEEIERLVRQLDSAAVNSHQTVRVVPLSRTSTEAVLRSLQTIGEERRRRSRQ